MGRNMIKLITAVVVMGFAIYVEISPWVWALACLGALWNFDHERAKGRVIPPETGTHTAD